MLIKWLTIFYIINYTMFLDEVKKLFKKKRLSNGDT